MHRIADIEPPVRYRPEVLEELRCFGVAAHERTQPRVPYQFLRALMTFEIRDLKARRRELERVFGPQPLEDYATGIESLRAKYALLRSPVNEWLVGDQAESQS